MTVSHLWPDIPPHRTVSMYCVSTLSLLISIHPWLYHTGDLAFLPTELWACTVCRPCLFLYPYIIDCIALAVEQPNIPPNWIYAVRWPCLLTSMTVSHWHWSDLTFLLSMHCDYFVFSCIHTSLTVSHWLWPDLTFLMTFYREWKSDLWFSCRWLGVIHKMITFFFFFTHTFVHFEEIMSQL